MAYVGSGRGRGRKLGSERGWEWMLVSGRCWGWVAGRVGVRSWSGDEGVEIVARQIGGDGDEWEWWRCGCEVVTKKGTGEV